MWKTLVTASFRPFQARKVSLLAPCCRQVDIPVDPESHEPTIPPYEEKPNEPTQTKRARLLYQSRKRGMLENGLLLSTFADKYLGNMTETQLKDYDRLINLPSNDWDIYYWAVGVKEVPAEFDNEIMRLFRAHVVNRDKQKRLVQPDLK